MMQESEATVSAAAMHTARLVSIVREQFSLNPQTRVVIQAATLSDDSNLRAVAFVSVPDLGHRSWVFTSPLLDLSPHELRAALELSPKGHTYVAVH